MNIVSLYFFILIRRRHSVLEAPMSSHQLTSHWLDLCHRVIPSCRIVQKFEVFNQEKSGLVGKIVNEQLGVFPILTI